MLSRVDFGPDLGTPRGLPASYGSAPSARREPPGGTDRGERRLAARSALVQAVLVLRGSLPCHAPMLSRVGQQGGPEGCASALSS